jgi:soluble lytic murein transglycosylase
MERYHYGGIELLSGLRLLLVVGLVIGHAERASASHLDEQRAAFRTAYAAAERGKWDDILPFNDLLKDYLLYPDLEGRALRATLSQHSTARLNEFLEGHPGHPEQRLLADQWLRALAAQQKWALFLHVWQRFAPQRPDSELACLQLQARMTQPVDADLINAALDRWRVGFSQPRACDPVFALLKEQGLLTPQRYQERLALALDEKQFDLAAFLARQLDASAGERVARWRAIHANPDHALATYPMAQADPDERQRVVFGLRRLAYRDASRARAHLNRLAAHYDLDARETGAVLRQMALGKAQRLEPDAQQSLSQVPREAVDDALVQWRLRTALRAGQWQIALQSFAELSDTQARSDEWQYWWARSLEGAGDVEAARQIYAALAENRSLHGFLSADRLQRPYAFNHKPTPVDADRIQQLAGYEDFRRARELFMVGLLGRARTQWERSINALPREDQAQAALLAHRWGWHSRSISTAARAGLFDDLELRYPLPALDWTHQLNADQRVDQPFALGVTRSEILFMPDVRSAAGAVGLMQLMPATGRSMARSLNLPYRGLATLTDPDINVRLGTAYLGKMLERFSANKVLATAAYNAGPHRVERWLPDSQLAADIWMDSIPFTETREYVRRVLESQAIVHWRLTGEAVPVSNMMPPINPVGGRGAPGAGSP